MVSSKKKKNGVFKKKEEKKKKNGVFKKKKKNWVGIQHVRDYRAQGETAGASALARVYSQLFYDSGHDWLFIYFLFVFFLCIVFCIIFFLFVFFLSFEDTIEKFRLLISKIYTQLTWNLPETYPKLTRPFLA